MDKIRVIIIEENKLYAKCLTVSFMKYKNIEIVGHAQSGLEYLNLVKKLKPHIALIGVKLNQKEALETITLSKELFPGIKLISFIFLEDIQYYFDLIETGSDCVLLKDSSISEIINSINRISKYSKPVVSPKIKKVLKEIKGKSI